jgi:hypothetical protein
VFNVGPEEIRPWVPAGGLIEAILFPLWPCELCFQSSGVHVMREAEESTDVSDEGWEEA